MAVLVRRKRLCIPSIGTWTGIMLSGELARVLQIDRKSAWLLLERQILPCHTIYMVSIPVFAVNIRRFQRWLTDPRNWVYLDVRRIRDPRFAHIVESTRAQWDDEWLTVGQVSQLRYVGISTINQRIHKGLLPAVRWGNWRVLKSDAMRMEV